MTQIYLVSSLFSGIVAAAAIGSDLFLGGGCQRLLLAYDASPRPELTVPWYRLQAAQPLLRLFDRVESLDASLHPYHPLEWNPQPDSLPLLARALRSHWGIGSESVELILDRFEHAPASALTRVFPDAPISVLVDDLRVYGPTRHPVPLRVSHRLERIVHADLIPGLRSSFLEELGLSCDAVAMTNVSEVVRDLRHGLVSQGQETSFTGRALVLGQHLAEWGSVAPADEVRLYADMISCAAESGAVGVVFKPHPSCTPAATEAVRQWALSTDAELEVLESPVAAELLTGVESAQSVWSCSSAGLVTMSTLHGLPVRSMGAALLLERLTPYQHSSRIPATIVHALHDAGSPESDLASLQQLIDAVAYCMQPITRSDLRDAAVAALARMGEEQVSLYFKRRRLEALKLR